MEAEVISQTESRKACAIQHAGHDCIPRRAELSRMRAYSVGGGDIVIEGRAEKPGRKRLPENSAEIKQFASTAIDLVEYIAINEGEEIWDFLADVGRLQNHT